jgi:pyruvate/2-oxoglutarate dehydrogenase complex dihydrolipoamide acyltransferase (E2) component
MALGFMSSSSARPAHRREPWPKVRNLVVDFVAAARTVPTISGFVEADVTLAREKLAERAARGEPVSFTAYLAFCISRALEKHPKLHGFRQGNEIVVFDDVDVNTLLEKRKPDGSLIPVIYIVRGANRKSLAEIDRELKGAVKSDLLDDPGVQRRARLLKLPSLVRRGLLAWSMRDPFLMKQQWGTVGLSNVGASVSSRFAVGTSFSLLPLTIIAGSISTQVMWRDERATPRQMLAMTIMVDHNLTDGMPGARFAEDFAQLLESASEL